MLLTLDNPRSPLYHSPVTITLPLLYLVISTSNTWAAIATGQQHGPAQSFAGHQPALSHMQRDTPRPSSMGLISTAATFSITPLPSSSTPKPFFESDNNHLHTDPVPHSTEPTSQTTTAPKLSTTPHPSVIFDTTSRTTQAPMVSISTTVVPQPSSISSLLVSRPSTTSAPANSSLASSQPQSMATTNARATSTTPNPNSSDVLMFNTFPSDPTLSRSNKSFEELSLPPGNPDITFPQPPASQPEMAVPDGGSSPVSNFENNNQMPPLSGSNQKDNRNFAQSVPHMEDHQAPQNSSLPMATHQEQPSNESQLAPASSDTNSKAIEFTASQGVQAPPPATNSSVVESREIASQNEPVTNPAQTSPEGRSQDSFPLSSRVDTNQPFTNTSLSTTNPKHQILKPKSKFKCNKDSDCQNGALCSLGKCYCSSGFTGDACETNINECLQAGGPAGTPCFNNGKCVDEIGGFRCECPPGYRGELCQDLADMCADLPCQNEAICTNLRTNYTCTCKPGWDGRHCEINIDDCAKNPCQNGATCLDLIENYECKCQVGYMGFNCEVNVDDCAENPCQNNATCRDLTNDYECECQPGFAGKNCQDDINECANSPCLHDGECDDLVNGYRCRCRDGWTGDQCESDVNECEKPNICSNNGSCINENGSYRCDCKDGFSGRRCSEISDFCKAKQPCGLNGKCKNLNSSKNFQCECHNGYVGKQCERKRTCEHHECNPDPNHAHCVSNRTCACLPGRREERIMCEYVERCEQVEGDLCLHGGKCKNLITGGYQCDCRDPWYGSVCQFRAESQFDAILLVIITCVGFLLAICAAVSLAIFRSVRKARATRGTYSPSTQEKFGNSASDLLKPPNPERLI